ncbi:ABC transporter ATP-binding protein [Pelagibacterium flavum]|uniref:ABC transporter ATP-binding protein n=1 Tax=Pelagibacterium flavum TaxID=2984530 RepID=A0ABY6ITW2_9HYPH|nr:ABC transporter ATP-binding protein [Pelagibacterium sp. YIM 151497]UYQ73145.1 ABC transporter ATP-binding protein [Pelagibacterium sp. YIM 151497]
MPSNDQPDARKNPARLTTQAIAAGYDSTQILSDVSLAVANGQMTVLVGPNGSGKSTLLKTMARILAPNAGQVLLDGKSIHAAKSVPRQRLWHRFEVVI